VRLCRSTQAKFLFAWQATATVLHERTLSVTEAAESFLFSRTARRTLSGWRQQVERGAERTAALRRVFESQAAAERKVRGGGMRKGCIGSWRVNRWKREIKVKEEGRRQTAG
jgi:hypothetical protein